MRARSLKAGRPALVWTAALLLGPTLVQARAAESQSFFVDADSTGAIDGAVSATAPAPPHPAPDQASAQPAPRAVTTASKLGEPSVDPEPDVAIKPPIQAPSKDPLEQPGTGAPTATAAPAEPLPPLNAALKSALDKRNATEIGGHGAPERRKERAAVYFFYAAHGFAPIWSTGGKPVNAVASVLARLTHAGDDALTVAKPMVDLKADGSLDEIAESELALTDAVVSYARQATGSRIDPSTINPLIGNRPKLADPAEVLDAVVGAGPDAGDKLRELNPREPRYVALRDALVAMRNARMPSAAQPIPAGPTLRIGMRDRRVPLIRARFGLGPSPGAPDDLKYDAQVADAVAIFQRANALPPSGMLTQRTIAALSGGRPSRLEGTLVANMEMWRWMPRDLGDDRIEVNIPDYLVTVFHQGTVVSQNRVVVGKIETPTPLFSNTMKYLIVNPYWNVPQSIIKKEMLPKGGGDLSYLERRGFSVAWHGEQAVVKQLPGPKNALGRIKFLFPNDYAVYLHDTPSKALFSVSKRAFSHGCVRVDKPFAFAESVLNDAVPEPRRRHWSEQRLETMLGDKERYVNLPAALPIHIEYFTVAMDGVNGRPKLREDIYGYAHAVAAALGQVSEPTAVIEPKARAIAEHHRHKTAQAIVDDGYDPR